MNDRKPRVVFIGDPSIVFDIPPSEMANDSFKVGESDSMVETIGDAMNVGEGGGCSGSTYPSGWKVNKI